jgi:hypothetical protein
MFMLRPVTLLLSIALALFATTANAKDSVAAKYELLGIKRWSQFGKVHVSVHIQADTDDPQKAIFSAIRVAERLASNRSIDFVRVFTRTTGTEWNKVARVQHAVDPRDLPVMQGKVWDMTVFWQNDNDRARMTLTDPDDITQPPGFADAQAIYQRECPSTGSCAFGAQSW